MTIIKILRAKNQQRLERIARKFIALAENCGGWKLQEVRIKNCGRCALIYFSVNKGKPFGALL